MARAVVIELAGGTEASRSAAMTSAAGAPLVASGGVLSRLTGQKAHASRYHLVHRRRRFAGLHRPA